MDSESENIVPAAGAQPPSETGSQTASRFWPLGQLVQRLRRVHWILAGGAAVGLVILVAASVFWPSREAVETEAVADPESATPAFFHASVARLVQAGEDSLRLHDFSPTADQLETLASIERLKILRIDGGSLTPEAGQVLASMPHLEQLHFRSVSLDDATLDAISESETIWLLNITGAMLSTDSISRLANMPKLDHLRLSLTESGNRYVEPIVGIKRLRALHLIGFTINNQSLKRLVSLPNLESLYLDDSNVTDEGWDWLFENKPYLHVHINQKHHDRDPQKH